VPRKGAAGFSSTFDGIDLTGLIDQEHPNFVVMRQLVEMVMGALSVMGSESVKRTLVKAPKFINSKRIARGEQPLNSYTTVTIDLTAFARIPNATAAPMPRRASTGVEATSVTCLTARRRGCAHASSATHLPGPCRTTTP
jgi:hypothetical protein